MFETTIYSTLANDTTLTGLCPNLYPQQPQDATNFPFMVYKFTRQDKLTFGGIASGTSTLTCDIEVYALTQAAVLSIAARIKTLINGFKSLPNVGFCRLQNESQASKADGYIYFVKNLQFKGMGT
jgi:hypothetical protein